MLGEDGGDLGWDGWVEVVGALACAFMLQVVMCGPVDAQSVSWCSGTVCRDVRGMNRRMN